MSLRHWVGVLVVCVVALAALEVFGSAQVREFNTPTIISGPDLGLRVEGQDRGNRLVGTLVVRINGQWVEVSLNRPGSYPLTQR
jgi:hypothetical protein